MSHFSLTHRVTAWLAAHGRLSRSEAHRHATVAERLSKLPVTAQAWEEGTLSSGHVGAVVANVRADRAELYAKDEEEMTPLLAELSVRDAALAMRSWRLHAEALGDGPEAPERPSELWLSKTFDGRSELSGHLSPPDAAVVDQALRAAQDSFGEPAWGQAPISSGAQRRAEALADICRWFLDNRSTTTPAQRNRPHVSVIVPLSELAEGGPGRFSDGTPIDGSTVSWLSCDSELHRIVMKGRSTVLDYGASVRTISAALWAALVARDGHCRHPGCDRPPSWCEGHHIRHFSKGGPTCLANLVLGCTRHHHLWHDQGWVLTLDQDATLTLVSPSGAVLTSRPPPWDRVA